MPQAATPQADIIAILAIGFSVYLGALQMSPHHRRFFHVFIAVGWFIIAVGCVKLVWGSDDLYVWITVVVGITALGYIAYDLASESYRNVNLKDYIFLWLRNGINWDEGKGDHNVRLCLTPKLNDESTPPVRISLPKQKCPARFTPVVQSKYDSLEEGTQLWITIYGDGLTAYDDELGGEWRPTLGDTTHIHQYTGVVERVIHYGTTKVGPNGVIKIDFPVGDYTVEYKIEGESKKGFSFCKEGNFLVHIYDATKS